MGPSNSTSPFLRAEVDCKAHWDEMEVKKFASVIATSVTTPPAATPPIATPVATAQPAAATTWMDEAVTLVLSKIKPEQLPSLSKNGAVPKDIDILLLREGCKKAGVRSLEETQKRELRVKFRSKIPSAKSQ